MSEHRAAYGMGYVIALLIGMLIGWVVKGLSDEHQRPD